MTMIRIILYVIAVISTVAGFVCLFRFIDGGLSDLEREIFAKWGVISVVTTVVSAVICGIVEDKMKQW